MVLDDKNVRRRFRASNYQVYIAYISLVYIISLVDLYFWYIVYDSSKAIHMHNANEIRWRLESNSI